MRVKNKLIDHAKPIDWAGALNDFLLLKKGAGRRERTLQDYIRYVSTFSKKYPHAWHNEENLHKCIIAHFTDLTRFSPVTYNIWLRYLRSFFKWCVEENIIKKNPTDRLKRLPEPDKIKWLEKDVVAKLITLPKLDTYLGLRDYALILFQLDTGARPNEALNLLLEHFDLVRHEVTIPYGFAKTRKTRTLIISPDTARAIKKLIFYRPVEWGNRAPVFCNQDGNRMAPSSWTYRMHRLYRKKLGTSISPYMLRHTFAIMYLRNGGSLESLRDILGHTTFEMVMRYAKLAKCDLHTQHEKASPVMHLLNEKRQYRVARKNFKKTSES